MKKKILSMIAIVVLGVLVVGCAQLGSSSGHMQNLYVSGSGTIDIEPDLALVRIGVRSQSSDIAEAFEDNNSNAETILQTLAGLGVAKEDIRTSNFSIYSQQTRPLRDEENQMTEEEIVTEEAPPPEEWEVSEEMLEEDNDDDTVLTYFVENMVSVTVRDLDSLG
jgi:uncharacterized protein YggE